MNFQVVTCADKPPTQPYYLWEAFNKSLERYDIKPVVLGWNQPWKGLGSKPKLLKKAIEDKTITARYIIFCDAFDVVFADNPTKIVEEYEPIGILWNAEKSCFPDANLAEKHPPTESPWKFLNSGLAAGRTEDFLQALEQMKVDEIPDDHRNPDGSMWHANDQDNWMRQFLFGTVLMQLDTCCHYFQTMFNTDELDMTGDKIRNTVTGTFPMAFHFNGGAKTQGLREPVLAKLNL